MDKFLYWISRILTILAILFMLMFSFDVFGGSEPLSKKLLGFLMHNIPVLLFIFILIIAWNWEVIGGLLLIAAFVAGGIYFKSFTSNHGSLIIIIPFLVAGILFIIHHLLYGQKKLKE